MKRYRVDLTQTSNVAAKFFAKEIDEIYNKTEGKISKL